MNVCFEDAFEFLLPVGLSYGIVPDVRHAVGWNLHELAYLLEVHVQMCTDFVSDKQSL